MKSNLLHIFADPARPTLILAPMQDITDLGFWRLIHQRGGADIYFTEYFRVHPASRLDRTIVHCIETHGTGRPVIAQMIGDDPTHSVRTARALQKLPIAAIDLNLGCPAPLVCKKSAGGGLLRHPDRIRELLSVLRDAIDIPFTVKTRIGSLSGDEFPALLEIFARAGLDALTVHGRTVAQMYRPPVDHARIREAAKIMPCPVIANGNVQSPADAQRMAAETGCAGLMLGRGAIRNPWLFQQIRQVRDGLAPFQPTLRDVLHYLHELFALSDETGVPDAARVARVKKFLTFIGPGLGGGQFLREIRRTHLPSEFFACAAKWLDSQEPFAIEPNHSPAADLAGCKIEPAPNLKD